MLSWRVSTRIPARFGGSRYRVYCRWSGSAILRIWFPCSHCSATAGGARSFTEPICRACCQIAATVSLMTFWRSEEHTSELQSRLHLVCRLLLEKKNFITDVVLSFMALGSLPVLLSIAVLLPDPLFDHLLQHIESPVQEPADVHDPRLPILQPPV